MEMNEGKSAMKIGNQVRWFMGDGHVMAGTILDVLYDDFFVKRVDGGVCNVPKTKCQRATPEDVLKACSFFEKH